MAHGKGYGRGNKMTGGKVKPKRRSGTKKSPYGSKKK